MGEIQFWLPEGTVVGDRYEIMDVLGVGGYGITYRGRDNRLDQLVAVKEFYPGFWASRYADRDIRVHCMKEYAEDYEKGISRFLDEAKTLASLSKIPEVVSVTDFFRENDTAYLVMEYLDGQNLKQMAGGFGGRIPPEVLIPVLEPLVKALGRIHQTGMIHRDISPDNIMMLEDGTVRLIDFGNARDASDGKSMTMAMKQGFAPPEQYRSKGQGTFTDVYGLCATIYYCMTGKLPPQAMERLMGAPFPTPTELGITISGTWESAVIDGLELYVQKRIQNMEELWQRLYGVAELEEAVEKVVTGYQEEYGKTQPTEIFLQEMKQDGMEPGCLKQVSREMKQEPMKQVPQGMKQEPMKQVPQAMEQDRIERVLQTGMDKIRDMCIQIYRKIKEKS